jgi:hypothetical protein
MIFPAEERDYMNGGSPFWIASIQSSCEGLFGGYALSLLEPVIREVKDKKVIAPSRVADILPDARAASG